MDTSEGTLPQQQDMFLRQLLSDYRCNGDCPSGRSYCSLEEILPSPESKHHCFTRDKTFQQEKERDKWRRRKSVLVWRGLLKTPHPLVNQEDQPERVKKPLRPPWQPAVHTVIYLLMWDVNRCIPFLYCSAGLLCPQVILVAQMHYRQGFVGGKNPLIGLFMEGQAIWIKGNLHQSNSQYKSLKLQEFWPACHHGGSSTQSWNTISVIRIQ